MQSPKVKSTTEFDSAAIEAKWQKKWESDKTFSPDLKTASKPYFNLMMFPYPSAEGLHVGNVYAFAGADVYGRFQRMQGNDVFEPMGLDGFGIHSENYALKVGRHPKEQAKRAEENFYRQLRSIGDSFDWSRKLETYDPLYYRWTQWLFVKLFQAGLAYRKTAEVNWCPKDLTVLSDEQVIDGACERCGSQVEKRELEQWFFRITKYADRLLTNIEGLDWTEKVKIAQRNWIGKKTGAVIDFPVDKKDLRIKIFTVYPETIFGVTYMVLAPEHPLVKELTTPDNQETVSKYIESIKSKSNIDRTAQNKEKTGVFTGSYVVNPVNGKKVPVWIADYVLAGFGTGAVMGVPSSDHRDFAFAQKYDLEIIRVIGKEANDTSAVKTEEEVLEEGVLVNSEEFSGLSTPTPAREKILDFLEKKGYGTRENEYHLRDWLISRQRYWGPPIPMIHCGKCKTENMGERKDMPGWYSVPLEALPIELPNVEDWKPMGTGLSPLANHPEFYETVCPGCGGPARRETDVSDTFLDSAWYFLGYISDVITGDPKTRETISRGIEIDHKDFSPWDKNTAKKWLPVTKYIGGAEHSVLHLLYARFISMVLYDLKLVDFEEPFASFFAHGLIIKDGAKMSKSKGNVVVPDQYITKYGADTLRTYLMFLGPFSDGGDFRDSGIEGMNRFLKRVWTLFTTKVGEVEMTTPGFQIMHRTIKKVTEDVSIFKYNTAIAALMEWYNFLSSHQTVSHVEFVTFIKLLAPFAPFMTEELYQTTKEEGKEFSSIHISKWPEFESQYLVSSEIIIVVQVNGKKRGEFTIDTSESDNKEKVESQAQEIVKSYLEGASVKKTIYVSGKIVNFVI